MIFPETVEEISLIVDMYGLTESDVEEWVEKLTEYMCVVNNLSDECRYDREIMEGHRKEAEQYSEECRMLSQELAARVKYDETLVVAVEFLAWECALVAGLAMELEAQEEELMRLMNLADAHSHVVMAYRKLLQAYLSQDEDYRAQDEDFRAQDEDYQGEDEEDLW